MKITEILEIADKANKAEKSWGSGNETTTDFRETIFPEMESKLRAMHKLMPEIKFYLQDLCAKDYIRTGTNPKVTDLLTILEKWKDE